MQHATPLMFDFIANEAGGDLCPEEHDNHTCMFQMSLFSNAGTNYVQLCYMYAKTCNVWLTVMTHHVSKDIHFILTCFRANRLLFFMLSSSMRCRTYWFHSIHFRFTDITWKWKAWKRHCVTNFFKSLSKWPHFFVQFQLDFDYLYRKK